MTSTRTNPALRFHPFNGNPLHPNSRVSLYNMPVMTRTALAGLLLAFLAISACTPTAGILEPTLGPPPTLAPLTPYGELSSLPGGTFTLVPPGGNGVNLNITACKGFKPGEPLNVVAENTNNKLDPGRIEVQITGVQQSTGEPDYLYLAIIMGAENKWTFMGSVTDAPIFLDGNGSGIFNNVQIPDTHVITYDFEPFPTVPFSGGWTCTP
jgi:hypothetical protein